MPTNADRRSALFDLVPEGMPVSKAWLERTVPGLDRSAIDNLLKSRQLTPLAPGVYMRPGTRLSWMGVAASLQAVFGKSLIIGGLTALELRGFAHYLPLSRKRSVHLYGRDSVPGWVGAALPDTTFLRHPSLPGVGSTGLTTTEYDTWARELVSTDVPGQRKQNWPFVQSSPERAFLEVLLDVPETTSFEHADQLLQGMTNLSPKKLEALLRKCTSVKVRRLFYWLAERRSHTWFRKLPPPEALDELGLGRGNRMLAKGGKLDAKYLITVPEDMWTSRKPMIAKSDS